MSSITLPPTLNALDPVERTRLRRSTRKLGDVLGMTPRLLDSNPLPSPSTLGAASLFFPHSIATSVTSVTEYRLGELPPRSPAEMQSGLPMVHRKQRSKQHVRPLVLCLWSAPATDTPPSPSTSLIPHSPSLESIHDHTDLDEADKFRRRKQIAKLTRTLGVNIPPELVFPHHRKNLSEPVAKLDKELQNPSPRSAKSNPVLPKLYTHHSRSITVSSPGAAYDLECPDWPSTSEANSGGSTPFSSQNFGATVSESKAEGWSGEWSISDPGQRALALRNLKGNYQ
ncbi:hypothetical protein APHAL10511_002552 [Amanita phalloides]|nr:hypothetical protein APHAL10511_002552 [Amanita phalloides]